MLSEETGNPIDQGELIFKIGLLLTGFETANPGLGGLISPEFQFNRDCEATRNDYEFLAKHFASRRCVGRPSQTTTSNPIPLTPPPSPAPTNR